MDYCYCIAITFALKLLSFKFIGLVIMCNGAKMISNNGIFPSLLSGDRPILWTIAIDVADSVMYQTRFILQNTRITLASMTILGLWLLALNEKS